MVCCFLNPYVRDKFRYTSWAATIILSTAMIDIERQRWKSGCHRVAAVPRKCNLPLKSRSQTFATQRPSFVSWLLCSWCHQLICTGTIELIEPGYLTSQHPHRHIEMVLNSSPPLLPIKIQIFFLPWIQSAATFSLLPFLARPRRLYQFWLRSRSRSRSRWLQDRRFWGMCFDTMTLSYLAPRALVAIDH